MLAMVRELKHAHDEVKKVTPGFVAWTSFYDKHICKRKRVCDLCEGTSGEDLHDQLEAEGVSLHVYDIVMDLYFDNSAFNAVGGVDPSFVQPVANQIQLDGDNGEHATEDEQDDTGKECGVDVILEIAPESSSDFEALALSDESSEDLPILSAKLQNATSSSPSQSSSTVRKPPSSQASSRRSMKRSMKR
ncbi:hypothetical protein HK096_008516, partial [Nowakowskiella sp. JEL0078]